MKIFNKLKLNLLRENNYRQYLIYALGEIILVVIGILIALSIDQISEKNANEEKVDAIFEVILEDLVSDINESMQIINTIYYVDTLSYQVLNGKNNSDNLLESGFDFFKIITYYNIFSVNEGGYQNLTRHLDIVPEKFNSTLKDLNYQYISMKESIKSWNTYIERLANKHGDYFANTYEWYSKNEPSADDMDELLNDFKYKNFVKQYQESNIGWLEYIWNYRIHVMNNYQNIAKILNKPIVHESFKIEEQVADLFIGKWQALNDAKASGQLFSYSFEDGRLFLSNNDDPKEKIEVFILSHKKKGVKSIIQSLAVNRLTTHIFEGDTVFNIINAESSKFSRVK